MYPYEILFNQHNAKYALETPKVSSSELHSLHAIRTMVHSTSLTKYETNLTVLVNTLKLDHTLLILFLTRSMFYNKLHSCQPFKPKVAFFTRTICCGVG